MTTVVSAAREVKGLWFSSARRYVLEAHGPDALAAVVEQVPAAHRESLAAPLASAWYPEVSLQECLAAANRVLARGNRERMLEVLEGCAVVGVNRFFRIALQLTSTAFALRTLPATWAHMRRGPGTMRVTIDDRVATIDYARFPFFDDPNYRLLVLGTLRPLLRLSTGYEPRVEIVRYTTDTLQAKVAFGAHVDVT